jgi:hypothetical protein
VQGFGKGRRSAERRCADGLEPRGRSGADLRPGCSMRNVPVVHWAFRPPRNEQDAAPGHTESTPTPRRQSLRLARPPSSDSRAPKTARRYSLCADLGVRNRCTGPLRKAGHFRYVPDGGDGHLERETRGIRPDLVLRASTTPPVAPSARKIRLCHKTRCSSAAARPIKIDHAEGAWLYTDDGRKILDADAAASRERSL